MKRGTKLDKAIRALIAERHPLIDAKLMGTITPEQKVRLAVVEAEIDRLEMIEYAPTFAANEARIARLEGVASQLVALHGEIDNALRDAAEGPIVPFFGVVST